MSQVPFTCQQCGSKTFKTASEPKSQDDLMTGAICTECGAALTENDIREQAIKMAEDAARRAGLK